MNWKEVLLGLVIIIVFWGYQVGYAAPLGQHAWFVGAIVFSALIALIGKSVPHKISAEHKLMWKFTIAFAIVLTFVMSYLGPYIGAVFPPGFDPSQLTPLVLSTWLMIFGAAMVLSGRETKQGLVSLIGIIWLFTSLHFVTSLGTGANSYIHFALLTGLPFVIAGLLMKK